MNKEAIELEARKLHIETWEKRKTLWPNGLPSHFDMLDPRVGAHILGITYQTLPEIKILERRENQYEIAGIIERQFKRISISERFPIEVQRFTGAHELGHWQLHPGEHMHRDRPAVYSPELSQRRPRIEKEADYFAACYLIPRKLLLREFRNRFSLEPLIINDTSAFYLCSGDSSSLLYSDPDSLACELAVASARSFRGQHFTSLAEIFKISPTAMAIRLNQMGLVRA